MTNATKVTNTKTVTAKDLVGPGAANLGDQHQFGTVIAYGYVNAEVNSVEYERLCILTLLPRADSVPNEKNYAVLYEYIELPPTDALGEPYGTDPIETVAFFPNIIPAVEAYADMGMDY